MTLPRATCCASFGWFDLFSSSIKPSGRQVNLFSILNFSPKVLLRGHLPEIKCVSWSKILNNGRTGADPFKCLTKPSRGMVNLNSVV